MRNLNDVFTNPRYIAPTQSELQALLLQNDALSTRANQLADEKLELQSELDAMTAAFDLNRQTYNRLQLERSQDRTINNEQVQKLVILEVTRATSNNPSINPQQEKAQ